MTRHAGAGLLAILLMASQGAAQGGGCFTPPVRYPTGSTPDGVLIGDFNNDGNSDFAVAYRGACESGAGVDVFLGDGTGAFQRNSVPRIDADPYAISAGDFNGDGNLDLAAALGGCGGGPVQLEVSLGNGDGTFQPTQIYSSGREPRGVAVGDFSGDGIPDLLINNSDDNQYLWLGNGDGTFRKGAKLPALSGADDEMQVADLNRDGKLDVVSGTFLPTGFAVQLGNGNGTFQAPHYYQTGGSFAPLLATGDLNGDGFADVVVATGTQVRAYLNNGDGTMTGTSSYSALNSFGVAIGDFTQDGFADVAVTRMSGAKTLLVRTGAGDGSFPQQYGVNVGEASNRVALGDFNHDGLLDIVTSDPSAHVSVLLNTGKCH